MKIIPPTTLYKSGLVLIAAAIVLMSAFLIWGMCLGHGMDALGLACLAVAPIILGAALLFLELDGQSGGLEASCRVSGPRGSHCGVGGN